MFPVLIHDYLICIKKVAKLSTVLRDCSEFKKKWQICESNRDCSDSIFETFVYEHERSWCLEFTR